MTDTKTLTTKHHRIGTVDWKDSLLERPEGEG